MRSGDVKFRAFDQVKVRLSIDSSNIQHEKLTFELVEPFIENFSVKKEIIGQDVKKVKNENNKRKQECSDKGEKKNNNKINS